MSAERRTAFRFLVQPEMNSATLRWRSHALTVELIDQSATGFSFKAPKETDIKLNETVELRSWAGECQAIVVRLTQQRDYLRVGLERTSDIIARPTPTRLLSRLLSWQPAASSQLAATTMRKHWIAAALLVLGIATVATCLAARDDDADLSAGSSDLSTEAGAGAKELATVSSDSTANLPTQLATNAAPAAAGAIATLAPAATNASPATTSASPSATFERLMTLRNPKTADALGLSQRQKLEISQLLGDLSSSVAKAKPQPTRKGQAKRTAWINSLIAAADSRLAQILTEEQQARWLNSEP